jgi:hypothetical protein
LIEPSCLEGDDTEQMSGIKVTRYVCENLLINLSGLSRVTGLMQGNSLRQ